MPTIPSPTCRLKSFWTYRLSWPHDTQVVTIVRSVMELFMNKGSSSRQWGQETRSAVEGAILRSPSQARHLKCIIALMKPLLVVLLVAVSVQAQSLADIARKERE